jgi:hypothetical protein
MEITPHLGIGDIILVKMKSLHHDLTIKKININTQLIKNHSSDYKRKIIFIKNFVSLLFPSADVEANKKTPDFIHFKRTYSLKHFYLYPCLTKLSFPSIPYNDYICFHTKFRHDQLIDKTYSKVIPDLIDFCMTFKTTKTIILTGEKRIAVNCETTQHKTRSLYNELLCLNKNNNVIDLTCDELTEGNPNFDAFINDIELINKSCCNITFGIGGNFCLCSAFSNNHLAMIPFLDFSPHKRTALILSNNICQTVESLANSIILVSSKADYMTSEMLSCEAVPI